MQYLFCGSPLGPEFPTGIIRGTRVTGLRVDARVISLSGSHGSVYRTGDGGATWVKVLSGTSLPE